MVAIKLATSTRSVKVNSRISEERPNSRQKMEWVDWLMWKFWKAGSRIESTNEQAAWNIQQVAWSYRVKSA